MRDLGLMGESTFCLWCGDAGIIPNGSRIDKTGWDFYVEFPFESASDTPIDMQGAALECKVQVKATDNTERKLQIKLSNLRRLITAQMPAFFVFIEFDGTELAKSAFLVHVDNDLISKVLKRLREIDQSEQKNDFNKRTMTIVYDDSHRLPSLDGNGLKTTILGHIDGTLAEYISNKQKYLESTGFEDGFAQIHFTTSDEENLKKLIDVSLGIEKNVDVSNFTGVHCRFGILDKNPFVNTESAKLSMPDLKPTATGKVRFKESKLSPGISFDVRFYISPLNVMVPDNLKKMRVDGEFFDIIFCPYTGKATYSFSFGEGIRLKIFKFRDAVKLLTLLGSSGNKLISELELNDSQKLEFKVGSKYQKFNYNKELEALESATYLSSFFDIYNIVDISLQELVKYTDSINQLNSVLNCSPDKFHVEFGVNQDNFEPDKKVICLFLVSTPLGSHVVGVILSLTGFVETMADEMFKLVPDVVLVESKFAVESKKVIDNSDIAHEFEKIENKYENEGLQVINMFDKCQGP